MTLGQIARYLQVDEKTAHAALNRIGVVGPPEGEDTAIMLLRDLDRAVTEIEMRRKWDEAAAINRTT